MAAMTPDDEIDHLVRAAPNGLAAARKTWAEDNQRRDRKRGRFASPLRDEREDISRPKIINAVELAEMKFKELKFIVPGLIPAGLTILAGRPKIGKSWLALHLSDSVSRSALVL